MISDEDQNKVKSTIEDALKWLEGNQLASKDEYDHKKNEVEEVCKEVISKLSSGMPGGMPSGMPSEMPGGMPGGMPGKMPYGMPDGMPGGMPGEMSGEMPGVPEEEMTNNGPKIEEVD